MKLAIYASNLTELLEKKTFKTMGSLSLTHILVLVVILLIFFGPSRLPSLGQSLGKAIRGFKSGLSGDEEESQGGSQRSVGSNQPDQISGQNQQSQAQYSEDKERQKDPQNKG